jgi:hypothetical protein
LTTRPPNHHLAFKDRHGNLHLPWDTTLEFCLAFCKAEPAMVLSLVDGEEREYGARGYGPGKAIYHQFMREAAAPHALVRQWCGQGAERDRLTKEIKRLQELVSRAAYELERAGEERAAGRLRRALRGE